MEGQTEDHWINAIPRRHRKTYSQEWNQSQQERPQRRFCHAELSCQVRSACRPARYGRPSLHNMLLDYLAFLATRLIALALRYLDDSSLAWSAIRKPTRN